MQCPFSVATPSPSPEGSATPFVTWGSVLGTPQHIAIEDPQEQLTTVGLSKNLSGMQGVHGF